jgi:hypothetical protein
LSVLSGLQTRIAAYDSEFYDGKVAKKKIFRVP